ncbi:MAG: hypothetical protein BIFFINMI_03804 [Phycisphaerae bacterium]|nr:hypothetical protein [Phycisphaerae bacterium]
MKALPHVVFAAALLAWPSACRSSGSQCAGRSEPTAEDRHAPSASSYPTSGPVAGERAPDVVILMRVTAYCACRQCCGPLVRGITASGQPVSTNGGHFVAADRSVPFGTLVSVPGYAGGRPVPVLDRGGAIHGQRIDVFFPSHEQARAWGVRWLPVTILKLERP